ncbi:hypothetical protein V1477_001329 [Vespula maculifrons]|uniref:Uncharacterized protein n=1 Tax=Vespula maculifrons TaxID=7453 RepID=A0ABD2D0U0_VESMC
MNRTIRGHIGLDISKSAKKKRRREREEKEAGICAHVNRIEFGRKERRRIRKVTHAARNVATLDQNQSTKIELVFSILKEGNPHRSPHPRAPLMGPTRKNN